MMVRGGPLSGACYYLDDWERRLRSNDAQSIANPYVDTGKHEPHPVVLGEVRVWKYVGG